MNDALNDGLVLHDIACPYCGEALQIQVDTSITDQRYIEDCQVCCRPIMMHAVADPETGVRVDARHEDD